MSLFSQQQLTFSEQLLFSCACHSNHTRPCVSAHDRSTQVLLCIPVPSKAVGTMERAGAGSLPVVLAPSFNKLISQVKS